MLDREERRDLVVLEDHLAPRVENEADVEEAVLPVGMARLGLRHDEGLVLAGDLAELLCLLPRDVDGALPGIGGVVEVQDLVVEGLQRPLRERDEPDRGSRAREPRGRLTRWWRCSRLILMSRRFRMPRTVGTSPTAMYGLIIRCPSRAGAVIAVRMSG